MRLDPKLGFPSQMTLSKEILPSMVTRCVNLYVQPSLDVTPTITATFDLWMSKGHHDTYTLIINFLLVDWKPHRVTIGLFEDNDTMGMGLAKQLKAILEKNCLMSKVVLCER